MLVIDVLATSDLEEETGKEGKKKKKVGKKKAGKKKAGSSSPDKKSQQPEKPKTALSMPEEEEEVGQCAGAIIFDMYRTV